MAEPIAELTRAAAGLRDDAEELARRMEAEGVADCVYNPLMYAWEIHEEFIRISGGEGAKTILLGMPLRIRLPSDPSSINSPSRSLSFKGTELL